MQLDELGLDPLVVQVDAHLFGLLLGLLRKRRPHPPKARVVCTQLPGVEIKPEAGLCRWPSSAGWLEKKKLRSTINSYPWIVSEPLCRFWVTLARSESCRQKNSR